MIMIRWRDHSHGRESLQPRTLEQNLDGITFLHLEVRGGLVVGNPLTVEQQSVIRTAFGGTGPVDLNAMA